MSVLPPRLLNGLLKGLQLEASDWHFTAGSRLCWRVFGRVVWSESELWSEQDVFAAWQALCLDKSSSVPLRDRFRRADDRTISFQIDSMPAPRRFRVHAKRCETGFSFNLRLISEIPATVDQLQLPAALVDLVATRGSGIVLVTGQTGSGKSTTLAALIELLNQTQPIKIVTYEAPIEVIFNNRQALVQQHDVGDLASSHVSDFVDSASSAMREDPDVVMFGELRDKASIAMAVEVAETGHLVLATLHTGDAVTAISRLVSASDMGDSAFWKSKVASQLIAVISQRLIPTRDGKLRGNYELLICNTAIANLIRQEDYVQIASAMGLGRAIGMQSFDDHLAAMVSVREYTPSEVLKFAPVPQETLRVLVTKNLITTREEAELKKKYAL
jgi:twitching motility protein PilT